MDFNIDHMSSTPECCEQVEAHSKSQIIEVNTASGMTEIQQSLSLHNHFYRFLVTDNLQAIKRIFQELQRENKPENFPLIRVLCKILKGKTLNTTQFSRCAIHLVIEMIKAKIKFKLANLSEKERKDYEDILIDHNRYMQGRVEYSNAIGQELTVKGLLKLDVLSVFLWQNILYSKFCKNKQMIITGQALYQIFQFRCEEMSEICKLYKLLYPYIRHNIDPIFHELASLYHALILINKIAYLAAKETIKENEHGHRFIDFYNEFQAYFNKYTFKYNFCQIAVYSRNNNIQHLCHDSKWSVIKELMNLNNLNEYQQLRKKILEIKLKYGINFDSLHKFYVLAQKRQISSIKKVFEGITISNKTQLEQYFTFIFFKDHTFDQAFKRFGLSQKYNLKKFARRHISNFAEIKIFVDVALKKYAQFSRQLNYYLKLEEVHKNQFIVVKKLVISYNQLKRIPYFILKGNIKSIREDLQCNLILITNRERIKSFCIVQGPMNDMKYVNILKLLIKDIQKKQKFIIVLYQHELGVQLQWKFYYRFLVFMVKQYKARVYITNMVQYSELNLLILSLVKMKISLKASSITRQNFYKLVQAQITEIIMRLAPKTFKQLFNQ